MPYTTTGLYVKNEKTLTHPANRYRWNESPQSYQRLRLTSVSPAVILRQGPPFDSNNR